MKLLLCVKQLLLRNGALTGFGILCAVVCGALSAYLSLEFLPTQWLKVAGLSIGLAVMGVGGYSARAAALGLPPPFTSDPLGWRKAKESYVEKATDAELKPSDNSDAEKREK